MTGEETGLKLEEDIETKAFLNKILFIYFERERMKNIDVREKHRLGASCTRPNLGPNLPPRHVP